MTAEVKNIIIFSRKMQEAVAIKTGKFFQKSFKKLLTLFIVYGIIYIELRLTLDLTEN